MLAVVGVTAFMLTRESLRSWHNAIGCVFGAALLFTSLAFVQEAARPLAEEPWFRTMLLSAIDHPVVAFLVGTVAAFVVQGSLAVTILTMNFHESGLVDYDSAVLLTYATNVGSSVALALLSIGLSGAALQIAVFGIGFNIVGALVMLPLYWIETALGVPLVLAGIAALTDDPELRVVLAYLLFNVAAAVVLFVLRGPVGRLLVRLFPEPPETEAARPAYLQRVALEDPATALLLAAREQSRALDLMEGVLEAGRVADAAERRRQADAAARAVNGLLAAVRAYLDEIRARAADAEVRADLTKLYDRQDGLSALADTLAALAAAPAAAGEGAGALRLALVEAVDTIRTHLAATLAAPDPASVELLEAMVGEKGEILARIRTSYLERESADDTLACRLELLDLTALFERAVWQLRRLSHALLAGTPGPADAHPHP